jgi:hypothetical protein
MIKKESMKRLLSVALSVYVLTLVLTPCVDNLIPGQETQCTQVVATHSDSHADHHDSCSPFCTCSCCNISMEVTTGLTFTASVPDYNEIALFFNAQVSETFHPQIWQPPKA